MAPRKTFRWEKFSDEKLLQMRICDLGVEIEGTKLERYIQRINTDLKKKGIGFRPHFWLSDEFFSPDGIPGVAIPFYLAHPRLERLEKKQMLEVEGGSSNWCMKILRHEVGHAIEHAYRLNLNRERIKVFGRSSKKYPETYSPKPYSKSFVLHLDHWYAQSHPDEDFAETFAVWFKPGQRWRKRYEGWPALKKLLLMDKLMKQVALKPPPVRSRAKEEPVHRLKKTLASYYREKRKRYGVERPLFYDKDLCRIFSNAEEYRKNPTAASFLQKHRSEIRRKVSYWTAEYQYRIDQVFNDIIQQCKNQRYHLMYAEDSTKLDFIVLLTVQTMNYLQDGHHRIVL